MLRAADARLASPPVAVVEGRARGTDVEASAGEVNVATENEDNGEVDEPCEEVLSVPETKSPSFKFAVEAEEKVCSGDVSSGLPVEALNF